MEVIDDMEYLLFFRILVDFFIGVSYTIAKINLYNCPQVNLPIQP
jgi:hypothetical protein